MNRFTRIGFGICLLIAILIFSGCGEVHRKDKDAAHKIVVLHSWNNHGEEGELFSNTMEKAFAEKRMPVELYHIYADMVHRPADIFSWLDWGRLSDSIKNINPEIILLNDDPIVDWLLSREDIDTLFLNTPTIFAGVNALQRDSLYKYPLMTGFVENLDLGRNISIFKDVMKSPTINIELDYGGIDDRLREIIYQALNDTARFINNADFRLETIREDYLKENYPNMAVVNFVSCAAPYTNKKKDDPDSVGFAMTGKFYHHAKTSGHLQVKRDIFSNTLINRSGQPQITCIREQFNRTGRPLFLGGYFTGTETQVEDQVGYAVRILNGEMPKSLPISYHESNYYMDWNAMGLMSKKLPYGKYSENYKIVNAPSYLDNPVEFSLQVGLAILVVSILVYFIVHFLSRWKHKGQIDLVEDLKHEEKVHDLFFSDDKNTIWTFKDGVFKFSKSFASRFGLNGNKLTVEELAKMVHPDSQASFSFLLNFQHQIGRKTVRLHLTPDGVRWFWAEATYTATEESARSGEIFGLLLNVDHKKETEEKLEQAQLMAHKVALKENFLANISHDLRTPLGAVTGFSSLLTMPGMTFEEGERESYGEIIHENTDMILKMIDSVMKKAQTDSEDLEVVPKPISVHKLVGDCYNTNRIIAPTHLEFSVEEAEPDTKVNIDLTRTKQVVNNFLSNAFKFTTEGSVTLGWKYIEGTEQIEVYVKDTGIGVAPEKQATLFERYIKVNETDRGTGLGLNISKTIIEKQQGTIGIESELGKGSKFFFRLTKIAETLLLIVTMAVGLLLPSSCMQYRADQNVKAKVLAIHTYAKQTDNYRGMDDVISRTFREHGVNADIKNVYLELDNPRIDPQLRFLEMKDSLDGLNWLPDVVVSEGDLTAHEILVWMNNNSDDHIVKTPIVLGALHHPEWTLIRKFDNLVAISDPIDYRTNIKLAVEMSHKNCVEIELDHFHRDSIIRAELRDAISKPPYIDGTDFHLKDMRDEKLSTIWKDSIVVLAYSTATPEYNTYDLYEKEAGYRNLRSIYLHSWLYPSVAVKKDMYSSSIVDKTGRPQYSAVRAGFADGSARYLCGYFADYRTVGADIARVASEIVKGKELSHFRDLTHEKNYFMDYQAMEILGMEYSDYSDKFIILNAPLEKTKPLLFYATWFLICMVFVAAIYSVLLVVQSWKDRGVHRLIDDVKRQTDIRLLALRGADSYPVRTENNVHDILSHIHPNYSSDIPLMMQAVDIRGTHSYDIYADVDGSGNYRWWQLKFLVAFDKDTEKRVDGILINIDELKKYEADLQTALNMAEEARQKESFLTTISHEIRIPLNAVVGFSDVLVGMSADSFSSEELAEYAKIIKANNGTLTTMIEDILMFSRIESGRVQYVKEEFEASQIVSELASEWADIMPNNVALQPFIMANGVIVNNDRVRIKYIINEFISNAAKFTKHGTINVGVSVHLNDEKVEFFVADSGCGIPKEQQPLTFKLFWKGDDFIPGLGLGLTVAQKMADGMGVTIAVESLPGFGSKYSLLADASFKARGAGNDTVARG